MFIFASESGQITGWNPGVPTPAPSRTAQAGANVAGAVFKGIALGSSGGNDYLYATDFHKGRVRVFSGSYTEITLAGNLSDPNIPSGYAPFGIQNIGGSLYVTLQLLQSKGICRDPNR